MNIVDEKIKEIMELNSFSGAVLLKVKEIEEIDKIFTPEQKAKLKVIIERHKAQKK